MFIIDVTKEDVLSDFKFIQSWIDFATLNMKEIDDSKIEFYYSYGFFLPKTDNKQELYNDMYDKCSKMLYNERLDFELSKVRVNLTMKIGKFFLSNRMENGVIPELIKKIVVELTKIKMTVESEYHGNRDVMESIPEIDTDIVSFDIIRDIVSSDYSESQKFDIDSILDKISKKGVDSLSDDERDFLDKKSKNI